MHLVQLHHDLGMTTAHLIKVAITRCQEKYGSANPKDRGSSYDSRWLLARLAAFDSMGWIEGLVVWCAEHSVTLNGSRGFVKAADTDRLMLQRAAREIDARWLSAFLLIDGRTLNFDVVGSFVKHHSKAGCFSDASCASLVAWLLYIDIFHGCLVMR